jgi:hypothetical protein
LLPVAALAAVTPADPDPAVVHAAAIFSPLTRSGHPTVAAADEFAAAVESY